MCRYDHYGELNPSKELAHEVKAGNLAAIETMAYDLAGLIQNNCYLVPVPNRCGFANNTLLLAHFVSGLSGSKATVLDIVKGNARSSVYELKKEGYSLEVDSIRFHLANSVPNDHPMYLLDNVLATGYTMYRAHKLIPQADILVHSVATQTFSKSPYRKYFGRVKTTKEILFDLYRQKKISKTHEKSNFKNHRISY